MRKILIVEDDPILRDSYHLILSSQPYVCHVAENGKVALDMIKKTNYDLVLLDIMMPVMNGVELLENLDNLDEMKSKIVIMSNLSSGKEIERTQELGIQQNVVKSDTSPSQLISLVRLQLISR
ncbi:MAG TPA: response regulator [Patescibacteria group bacterium]|jgi:DNA-binding response OmpR family regulator|nr:response regulator [Patescibacteria group bacterium]